MTNAELVKTAADTLRLLSSKVNDLESKIKTYEQKEEAVKLASELAEKNLIDRTAVNSIAEEWVETDKDLNTIREAVKLAEHRPMDGSLWSGAETPRGGGSTPEQKMINWIMGE